MNTPSSQPRFDAAERFESAPTTEVSGTHDRDGMYSITFHSSPECRLRHCRNCGCPYTDGDENLCSSCVTPSLDAMMRAWLRREEERFWRAVGLIVAVLVAMYFAARCAA